jgi:hypothetical protein
MKIIQFPTSGFIANLKRLLNLASEDRITHALCIYRMDNGEVVFHLKGDDSPTYLVGMLERVKTIIIREADDG